MVRVPWQPGDPIPEKQVRSTILQNQEERELLREDLRRMFCDRLLDVPWEVQGQ